MKKAYILLAAVLLMIMAGCSSGDDSSLASSAKSFTEFKITSPVHATGVITESTHTIAIAVPYDTVVTDMVATFTTTGKSVKVGTDEQISGTTHNDFTEPKDYIVTADDSSTQIYTVTVIVIPRSGSLDTTFGTSGMVTTTIGSGNSEALALGIQSSGKIVVAGRSYNSTGSKNDFAVVRYNADGTLDSTFGSGGIVTTSIGTINDEAFALVIHPDDDSIVVAGSSYNDSSKKYDFALVKYTEDGILDTTFNASGTKPGTVTTSVGNVRDYAQALRIQPSGNKIVVAGVSFNSVSRKYDFALVRYNADGTLDKSGTPGTGFGETGMVTTSITGSINDLADDLVIQPDGKIIVTGQSNNDGDLDFALVRYNTDGTLDTGFGSEGIVTTQVGSGVDYAHALVIQPDGKIVAAGSSANGSDYDFALVRYNADGSLDKSGTPGIGFGTTGIVTTPIGSGSGWDVAYALGIQPDGKILVAGSSSPIGSFIDFPPDFALVRYNTDGSLDDKTSTDSTPTDKFGIDGKVTTPIGSGWDDAYALGIQSDGKILVAGRSYNVSNTYYDFALVRYLPQ